MIRRWKAGGKTVLIAEHRLHFLEGLADRVLFMENGEIKEEYAGAEFFGKTAEFFEQRGLRLPSLTLLDFGNMQGEGGTETIALQGFCYGYRKGAPVLDIKEARFPAGAVAVVGHNGAGKTTFAKSLCGLLKKDRGELIYKGERMKARKRLASCYMVMQDVNHQLFTESVLDEILLSMKTEDGNEAETILGGPGPAPFEGQPSDVAFRRAEAAGGGGLRPGGGAEPPGV